MMDDKRVADYFVVAGLPENPRPLDEVTRDGNTPKTTQPLVPITDVAVIIRSQGELPPKGYSTIEVTPMGFPADLNHGSLRSPNIYLCYRRGRDKPPLVDIGVLYDGKERVMADSEVVLTTPSGRSANVNNSGSRTFLTYRRAPDNAPCNQLVVTDICITLANKGEQPPRAYCLIEKNLNKGVLGSDVYLCYKKSMNRPDMICYNPGILGRFPLEDYENFELPQSVAVFCLPMGATIECWPKSAAEPKPLFSTFVLTSDLAEKVYGAAVTFYERFPEEKLTESMKTQLNYWTEDHRRTKDVHTNKSICILSRWPFYDTFEKFLRYLHRMSISGIHKVPLERVISHFMLEIPFPSPQRPRILIQLADCTISLAQPEDTPLPLSGASYAQLLKTLGPDNSLKVLFYVLTEQKILFHSLRPDVLTSVAEAVVQFIFPFHWQCPYIPLCPLGLSEVLCAPVPYLVGLDSRFFDLHDPPHDVTCIDLDTNSIFLSDEKRNHSVKLLPKRPARILRNTLVFLYEKLGRIRASGASKSMSVGNAAMFDYDFKAKRKERQLELEIQEAFLRFMSSLLKGYRHFLKPITTAPTIGTTDPNSLFDFQGFMRTRDKTYNRFYMYMMKTQMFIRFIEERSFVSDKDAGLAFFDECTEKVDSADACDVRLLEIDDSQASDRTVFIAPPEPIGLPPNVEYTFSEFGRLKPQLFHRHPTKSLLNVVSFAGPLPNSPMARRTKQEIKNAQRIAKKQSETPVMWAKCLVGYCFSLWFIHLPSYVKQSPSKSNALRMAFDVLVRMQLCKLSSPEEGTLRTVSSVFHQEWCRWKALVTRNKKFNVCYRVLMLLCGLYSQPTLAVKVLFEMKRNGIQPNAITYGYYNKAVLESKWPSADAGSTLLWNRLRNVIIGVAQFRQGVKKKARRSLSLCSDIDYDRISRTSTEGSNPDDVALLKLTAEFASELVKPVDDRSSSEGQSDGGYSSLNPEDGLKTSLVFQSSQEKDTAKNQPIKKEGNAAVNVDKHSSKTSKCHDIDFSASDAFRSRVGSIVKSSATSINSLARLHDSAVDSAAGILMTTQAPVSENCVINGCDHQRRRRHKSAGEHACRHYRRYKMQHGNGPLSESMDACDIPVSFNRSYSFGNDFQIIRKIREAKDGFEKNGIAMKIFDSPLKKSFYSDKKQDGRDQNTKSFNLAQCLEESEADLDGSPSHLDAAHLKPPQRSRSPSVPLYLDTITESQSSPGVIVEQRSMSVDSDAILSENHLAHAQQEKDFISNTFTPLKEAWMNWDFFSSGGIPRMASSISNSLGLNQATTDEKTPRSNKVTRSSTFHGGSRSLSMKSRAKRESMGNLEDNGGGDNSMSRSSTLPVTPRSKSIAGNKLPGMSASGWNFSVGSSSFGISRLTSKHSEVLFDSLKSAVTSVSSKINEIKSSLSATNTPTKGNFNSPGRSRDIDRMALYGEEDNCDLSSDGHCINADYLTHNGYADDICNGPDFYKKDFIASRSEPKNCLPHVGSAPTFSSQAFEIIGDHAEQNHLPRIAMDVVMTTCSRCMACSSLLYDEEIMEGWSADDSNLNTQCSFCKVKLVPSLTITIKDYRWEGSSESLLTPAYSTESVSSAPVNCHPSLAKPSSIQSRPKPLGEKNSTRNSSIDSNTEAFILLEDSPEREEAVQANLSAVVHNLQLNGAKPETLVPGRDSQRNSIASSLDDAEVSAPPSLPKSSQHSQSIYLSSGDIRRTSVNGQDIEPLTVPYLSPLVLRKELENVLEQEGDNCMTKPEFVDQHPILYWNLVWFFKRIGVPSHLSSLVLQAHTVNKGKQIPALWQKADSRNISICCAWDNSKLHENMGHPLYMSWALQDNAEQSSLVYALLTEETKASKSIMKQVLGKLQCNDLYTPLCILINERMKSPSTRKHHHSIYREILFLSFIAIGREDIDSLTFDMEYRKAYEKLTDKQLSQMQGNDRPPSEGAVFCRRYFKDLELKVR